MKANFNLLLLLSFLIIAGCGSGAENEQPLNQKVLLISIDGFMNTYIDRNPTPNFDRMIESGVKADRLIPVFPTKTFPNHYSQVTGLLAEHHGIISNSFPDDTLGGRFSYGPPDDSPNDERWWGGEPIWTTAERQGKTSATMFWPGSEASINGVRPTKWKEYDGSVDNYSRIDSVMSWLDPAGDIDADLSTLYFSHVDSRGHSYGPNSAEVDQAVMNADSLIGYLWEKIDEIGLREHLNVILVSDHGMAELSEEKVIFLDDLVDMDSFEMIDVNPVAMLKPNEGMSDAIYNALKEQEENYRVYRKEELPEIFGFVDHYRIPEIIMVADVPYTITTHSYFDDRGIPAGMHGYDNRAPEMAALFIASGPAFKKGESSPPVSALNLYELMAYILDLEPAENDGELYEVKRIMVDNQQ
jgi:predicted AlkP superfamily pyrophosphatase or phosphodiesterase